MNSCGHSQATFEMRLPWQMAEGVIVCHAGTDPVAIGCAGCRYLEDCDVAMEDNIKLFVERYFPGA